MSEAEGAKASGPGRVLRIALLSTLLLFVVLELGLRAIGTERLESKLGKRLAPDLPALLARSPMEGHPHLGYAGRPNFATAEGVVPQKSHNEWGFRGPSVTLEKPEGVYRVVCLGGSSTYGHGPTSDATTWPARLQHFLNDPNLFDHGKRVEVLNGGLSGWSTFESSINLAHRMIQFEPDLVIVYHTINDMRCALYDPPLPPEQRAFPEPMIDNRHWRAVWPSVVEAPGESLLENSMTYLVLRARFSDYASKVDSLNSFAIVDYDPAARELYRREGIPETGFASFERNLRSIHAIAAANGALTILASQGNDDRDLMAGSAQAQLDSMARMTRILERVAQETGAVFVDAKTQLEARAAEGGIDEIFTKEVHMTDEGANRLALIFAEALRLDGHGFFE